MKTTDKSQEPQTRAGPRGRQEGRFQARAAPTSPQLCVLALPSPAIAWLIPTCPSKLVPALPPLGVVLPHIVPGRPFKPLPQSVITILCFCVWDSTPHPRRQAGLSCPGSPPHPLPPWAGGPGNPRREGPGNPRLQLVQSLPKRSDGTFHPSQVAPTSQGHR